MVAFDTSPLRHADTAHVLALLQGENALSPEQLQAALANAFERIRTMEGYWEEFRNAVSAWDHQFKPPEQR